MHDRTVTNEVTALLIDWSNGDKAAYDKLVPLVHDELYQLAHRYMGKERAGHTLQTTALVDEAYLKLVDKKVNWQNRTHFFAIAANVMRRILVDHARAHAYQKRGGGAQKLELNEAMLMARERASELVALDESISQARRVRRAQSSGCRAAVSYSASHQILLIDDQIQCHGPTSQRR